MLDNLFNSILVCSFLAISTFGALASSVKNHELAAQADAQYAAQNVAKLERVVVTGHSLKADRPV